MLIVTVIVIDMKMTAGLEREEKVVNETVTETAIENNSSVAQSADLTSVGITGEKVSDNMTPPAKKKKNAAMIDTTNLVLDANGPVMNIEDKQPTTPRVLPPLPRFDPRVHYPLYPLAQLSSSGFTEPNPHTVPHPTYPHPNVTHQASFPQPGIQFPMQKVITPNYFPQMSTVPTYPPVPAYSFYANNMWQSPDANPNNMASNPWPQFTRANTLSTAQHLQNFQAANMVHQDTVLPRAPAYSEALNCPLVNKAPAKAPVTHSTVPAAPGSNGTEVKTSSGVKTDEHKDAETAQPVKKPVATDRINKKSDSVQILPQALVDGAINVASTAYSTAWNALNNLRTTDGIASVSYQIFLLVINIQHNINPPTVCMCFDTVKNKF